MTCYSCRTECRKIGKRANRQRYQCNQCRKVFTDDRRHCAWWYVLAYRESRNGSPASARRQPRFERERATDAHHTTILKLLLLTGEKCERIMAAKLRNVEVRDEVWSFIGKKQKRVRPDDNQLLGDCYVFVGI